VIFFCICAGTVATLAVASASYLEQFIPLGTVGRKVVSVLIVGAIAWLNVRGTRISVTALNWGTAIKVAALAFLIVVLPFTGDGLSRVDPWLPSDFTVPLLSGVGLAMISVLWAYEGWQYATFVAGEVKEPQRNLPWGLAAGTLALVAIYVLANLAYLAALGPEGVASSQRVAAEAVQASFGPTAGRLIAIPIIVSMISAAHSVILTMPRAYFAMARDGVFFRKLGEVHPRFGTPAFAIIAGALVAAVLSLVGGFNQLLSYVIFVGWMFYGLAGASVFVFRRTRADWPRPFKVPGYPVTPILFVLSAWAIVVNALFTQPLSQTLLGLGVVATGVPAYFVWRTRAP
jgi:APA family basic amino acid/polyamine antiporter